MAAVEVLHPLDHQVAMLQLPHLVETVEQQQDFATGELLREQRGEGQLEPAVLEVTGEEVLQREVALGDGVRVGRERDQDRQTPFEARGSW